MRIEYLSTTFYTYSTSQCNLSTPTVNVRLAKHSTSLHTVFNLNRTIATNSSQIGHLEITLTIWVGTNSCASQIACTEFTRAICNNIGQFRATACDITSARIKNHSANKLCIDITWLIFSETLSSRTLMISYFVNRLSCDCNLVVTSKLDIARVIGIPFCNVFYTRIAHFQVIERTVQEFCISVFNRCVRNGWINNLYTPYTIYDFRSSLVIGQQHSCPIVSNGDCRVNYSSLRRVAFSCTDFYEPNALADIHVAKGTRLDFKVTHLPQITSIDDDCITIDSGLRSIKSIFSNNLLDGFSWWTTSIIKHSNNTRAYISVSGTGQTYKRMKSCFRSSICSIYLNIVLSCDVVDCFSIHAIRISDFFDHIRR